MDFAVPTLDPQRALGADPSYPPQSGLRLHRSATCAGVGVGYPDSLAFVVIFGEYCVGNATGACSL